MPDNPSLLNVLLHRAVTPLTTAPSQLADKRAMEMTNPTLGESKAHAMANGFGAGALQGIGKMASGMTSPLGIALMAAGPLARGVGSGATAAGEAMAPAAETLGETAPEFTPVGGEDMYNTARAYTRYAPDPQEQAYQRILANKGAGR